MSGEKEEKAYLVCGDEEIELDPGPIAEAAEELGIPFGCSSGICCSCMAEVIEGEENLHPKEGTEKLLGLPDNVRLCCQARIKGGRVKIDW